MMHIRHVYIVYTYAHVAYGRKIHSHGKHTQVLQDMLQLLKESSSSRHAERLEQIVIALIGIEIGVCRSVVG